MQVLQGRPCRNKVQTRSREHPGTGFQAEVWLTGLCMGARTPTHTHPGPHQSGEWARGIREAAISTGTGETGHSLLLLTFEHATAYLTTPLGYLGISNLTQGNQIDQDGSHALSVGLHYGSSPSTAASSSKGTEVSPTQCFALQGRKLGQRFCFPFLQL